MNLRKHFKILAAFAIAFTLLALVPAIRTEAAAKKGLVIMLDGLRSDALLSASTPSMDSIITGEWAPGYKSAWTFEAHTNLDSPPSSATNHVAIVTGVTATKNNCYENGQIPQTKWDEYPSYMSRLRKTIPDIKTAWIFNWGEDADIQSDATYVGEPSGDEKLSGMCVQFLNGTFPAGDGIQGSHWSEGDDIDLVTIYLDSVDGNGHGHGFTPNSDNYIKCVEWMDEQIGKFLAAIKGRPNFADEDWLVAVVSDHGGIGRGHGVVGSQNCYTIPILVSSRNLPAGRMKGQPLNCDVAAYVMNHFTGKIPAEFDGKIEEASPDPARSLSDGLLAYFPFEGDVNPAFGEIKAEAGIVPPDFVMDGQIGKAVSFVDENPISLGKPTSMQFGANGDFTIAFWFRTSEPQKVDAPFLGNKNWNDGQQAGVLMAANVLSDEGTKLELNMGDGSNRLDLNPLEYQADGQWRFAAATADRDGNAVLYLGEPTGRLSFISDSIAGLGDLNNLGWKLGQDGTGSHGFRFTGDMDEFMVWNRPLTNFEVNALYKAGLEKISILKASGK